MDVFHLRQQLIADYGAYSKSFVKIRDRDIRKYVDEELDSGVLWPDPLIQLNPRFKAAETVGDLAAAGVLHPQCADIFRFGKSEKDPIGVMGPLHRHQADAVHAAQTGDSYVLITGTGSGKSLAYFIPIVDYALKNKAKKGIKAIVIYPIVRLQN